MCVAIGQDFPNPDSETVAPELNAAMRPGWASTTSQSPDMATPHRGVYRSDDAPQRVTPTFAAAESPVAHHTASALRAALILALPPAVLAATVEHARMSFSVGKASLVPLRCCQRPLRIRIGSGPEEMRSDAPEYRPTDALCSNTTSGPTT